MSRPAESPERELNEVAHDLRHLTQEEKQEGLGDARRRRYDHRKARLLQRLEHLLWFLVEEPDHGRWRAYVRGGERPGGQEPAPEPLLFKGRTDGGEMLEMTRVGENQEITIDGTVEHGQPSLVWIGGGAAYQLGDRLFREVFESPEPALAALRGFLTTPKSPPPLRWARQLWLDGVIDTTFGLTDRGRRWSRLHGAARQRLPGAPGAAPPGPG